MYMRIHILHLEYQGRIQDQNKKPRGYGAGIAFKGGYKLIPNWIRFWSLLVRLLSVGYKRRTWCVLTIFSLYIRNEDPINSPHNCKILNSNSQGFLFNDCRWDHEFDISAMILHIQRCKARFRNGKDLDTICLKAALGKNTNLFTIKT